MIVWSGWTGTNLNSVISYKEVVIRSTLRSGVGIRVGERSSGSAAELPHEMHRAPSNWIARPGLIRAQLSGAGGQGLAEGGGWCAARGEGGRQPEPRGLAAPPARAALPGELIQVASAPRASRYPQVCPFCFWCLPEVYRSPRAPRVSVLWVNREPARYVRMHRQCRTIMFYAHFKCVRWQTTPSLTIVTYNFFFNSVGSVIAAIRI